MDSKTHWQDVYETKKETEVSWYRPQLERSLELIERTGIGSDANIIDVGGGASTLVDSLLEGGFKNITVLDISSKAIASSKKRLGTRASRVNWVEADITKATLPKCHYDLWHDRALFHFLTQSEDRKKYVELLRQSLKPGGHVIIASFSLDGPLSCSGLDVARYSSETLGKELGTEFSLVESFTEDHETPSGKIQKFVYCRFMG